MSFLPPGLIGALTPQDGLSAFTLATLSLTGSSVGNSPLFTPFALISDDMGNPIEAGLAFGTIDVLSAPVPEPATLVLFGTGIAGLVSIRNRKKDKGRP
jgi:hypothetical protein